MPITSSSSSPTPSSGAQAASHDTPRPTGPSPDPAASRQQPGEPDRHADLVLEAGGVKGIALAGAIRAFSRQGYGFRRIAGTSAGALAGSILAAMTAAGESPDRVVDITRSLDRSRLTDRAWWGRAAARIGLGRAADALSVLLHNGMYSGDYLQTWLSGVLGEYGVRTFGDLRLPPDPESDLPPEQQYRLVVVVADVSRHRMARFPWDYADYGLEADEQPVVPAVRASTAIPFFFQPEVLDCSPRIGRATLVDGGVVSGYPITIFDRTDGRLPRWPTFGVRLSAPQPPAPVTKPVRGPISLGLNLVSTMTDARDTLELSDPCQRMRTTFVDTEGISGTDFDISDKVQEDLIARGERAVERFLQDWSFERYRSDCGCAEGGPAEEEAGPPDTRTSDTDTSDTDTSNTDTSNTGDANTKRPDPDAADTGAEHRGKVS